MPTYEYECTGCGKHFDEAQPITAKPLVKCRDCGGRLVRLIGAGGGIIFKGSGFYATDYRSDDYKKKASSEKTSSGDSKSDSSKETARPGEKKGTREHKDKDKDKDSG